MVLALWRGNKLSHLRKAWPPTSPPLVALATGPLPPQRNQGFHRVHTLHSGGGGGAKQGQLDQPSPGSQSRDVFCPPCSPSPRCGQQARKASKPWGVFCLQKL